MTSDVNSCSPPYFRVTFEGKVKVKAHLSCERWLFTFPLNPVPATCTILTPLQAESLSGEIFR